MAIGALRAASITLAGVAGALAFAVDRIASTATSDVVDWSDNALPPHLPFKLFVETEDGAFAGWMYIPGAASACLETFGDVTVERSQGGRSSC